MLILQIANPPTASPPTFQPLDGLYEIGAVEVYPKQPIVSQKPRKSPHNRHGQEKWFPGGDGYPVDSLYYDGTGPIHFTHWPNRDDWWFTNSWDLSAFNYWVNHIAHLTLPDNWDSMTPSEKWNWLWDHTNQTGWNNNETDPHGEDRPWSSSVPIGDGIEIMLCLLLGYYIYYKVKL